MQICVRQPLFGSNEKSQLCVSIIVAYDPDKLREMLEKVSESALISGGRSLIGEMAIQMLRCSKNAVLQMEEALIRYLPSYTTL